MYQGTPQGPAAVEAGLVPCFSGPGLLALCRRTHRPLRLVRAATGAIGAAPDEGPEDFPVVGRLPAIHPEWLGCRGFAHAHGVRFPYVVGEMAHAIASPRMVVAAARAGMLGFLGTAGLPPARIEAMGREVEGALGPEGRPWGANLIHSPAEPGLEMALAELFLRLGVARVSASAFMGVTPAVVRLAAHGLREVGGRIVRPRGIFAKVSRPETARGFMAPPPEAMLRALVADGRLSEAEAALAARLPIAEDVTAEADSGGHTDNRPLTVLLPRLMALRDEMVARHGRPIRVGAAGGIGTPGAAAAAFGLGADYVLTGSVNQACVEAGLSPDARAMLAGADMADTAMAASADMFELGVKVQVLRRGTLYASRANLLHALYSAHASLEALPADARARLERDLFRMPLEAVWDRTPAPTSPTATPPRSSAPSASRGTAWRWCSAPISAARSTGPSRARRTGGRTTRSGAAPRWAPSTPGPRAPFSPSPPSAPSPRSGSTSCAAPRSSHGRSRCARWASPCPPPPSPPAPSGWREAPIPESTMRDDQARAREPVAVVGMAALCPGDPTTEGFLSVMMEGRDQIRDVPPSRFSLEDFHAPDPSERGDRTYCTRGAFIDPVPFDPMAFGIPPSVIAATDSAQLLTLLKARELMEDAGIDRWGEAARERVGVILGAQGMTHLQGLMMSRIHWPAWVEELRAAGMPEAEARAMAARINGRQPGWQEMSFPGFLGNITAGRVTNRLDLGGTNYVVDAACASSLSAISAALNELYLGQCDAVITGGCDLLTDAGTFLSFANSTALSKSGDCRPFSADADGTVIGEGVALLALRRLADAERDGDAIHAVIRGHGTASDGRGSAIYAPRSEGQVRAMERAYEAAGYGAETVGLIEAHGTGTGLGDATEVRSMSKVFGGPGRRRRAALGSVKSLIGHPKTSAGAVSLLKVVTALRHGVLPPTIKVGTPNEALAAEGCPVHPNTVARPWIAGDEPRRAGLSAFGFGGTNAHVTVEEYRGPHRAARRLPLPAQLLLFSGGSRADVLGAASEAAERVGRGASLDGVARASQGAFDPGAAARLALVARAAAGLSATLVKVTALLERTGALPPGLDGAAYAEGPAEPGRVAFLFPGQGSQRVGMAGELAMHFEAARAPWDADDAAAREAGEVPLHEVAFPDPALSEDDARAQEERLRATEMAQPALALATLSHLALTEALGLRPDLSLGHSFGEVMALHAAGAFDGPTAVRIARERGRLMREAGRGAEGAMTSLSLPAEEVEALIARSGGEVRIANRNAPRQVVVSGLATEVERLEALCPAEARRRLPVSTAFHSPVVADAAPRFAAFLEAVWTEPPAGTVLADLTAAPYPEGIDACRETLASQIAEPVLFEGAVRAAFEAGARTFVEVGPGSVLSRLAAQCLEGEPAEAVPLGGSGVAGFLGGLARLAVRGVALRWDALSEDRRVGSAEPPPPLKPHVVWVDSTMLRRTEAERLAGVEPRIVGAAPGGRIEAAHAAASPRDGAAGGGRPELDRGAAHPDPDMGRLNGAEQSAAADPPANGARPPFDHASLPRPDGSAPRAAQERTFRGGEDAEPTRLVAGQDPSGGMDIGPAWTAAQRVRSDGAPVSAEPAG